MRIALAGAGRLAVNLMNALMQSHHEVVAVAQDGRQTKGANRSLAPFAGRWTRFPYSITGIASRRGIPIIWINKMTEEELAPLRAVEPDILLVGGFGIILKGPLLELPKLGCINTHSSLLPRHRGPNPFTTVLLTGDSETGVTFHRMDEGIDTGDILCQRTIPIRDDDTASSLYIRTSELAGESVLEMLDKVEREGLNGTPQDAEAAQYFKKLKPEQLVIDWTRPAEEIDRFIRALFPFHMARCGYDGHTVYVARARFSSTPVDAPPGAIVSVKPRLTVATGKGSVRLNLAYTTKPVPWFWPPLWKSPRPGDRMEMD